MPDFEIGRMRHRVTLLRDLTPDTVNSVGQHATPPLPIGTHCALVECKGGSVGPNGDQLKSLLDWRVTMRANVGPVRPSDKLRWTNQGVVHTLNVVNALVDPFNVFIVVDCQEKAPNQ